MRRYAKLESRGLDQALAEHATVTARYLAHATQPYGPGRKARKQGEAATGREVMYAYGVARRMTGYIRKRDPKLAGAFAAAMSEGDFAKASRIAARVASWPVSVHGAFDGGQHHRSRRDRRGHFKRGTEQYVVDQAQAALAYLRKEVGMVGFAKAGWATAIKQAALGRYHPKRSPIQKWITRHNAPGKGRFHRGKMPWIELENRVSYIDKVLPPRKLVWAARRGSAASYRRMNKALDAAAKKTGLD